MAKNIDFQEVRNLCAAGHTQRDVARRMGISRSYVSDIVCFRVSDGDPEQACKLQQLADAKRYAKSRLREGLRNEDVITHCAEIASESVKPLKPVAPPKFKKRSKAVQETLVVVLSDGHHDQVVRAEEVGGLENYNFAVSCRRGQAFVDATIKYAKHTLVGYDFQRVVVLSLGDNTSGEIHEAERRSAFGNQFKNTMAIGGLHAAIFRDLAAHFPKVEVHALSGNHGRRTNTKEYPGGAHNNWDYMVNKVAQAYCSEQSNIQFHIPNSWDTVVDVEGYGIHASHGDDVAGGGSPWLGLSKRHQRQAGIHRGQGCRFRNGDRIDYAVIGHYHTEGFTVGNGVGYVCNGAWLATDPYAYQKLGVAGVPSQWIFGVHKDHGATWRLPVQIATMDEASSCRYDRVMDTVDGLDYALNFPRTSQD